jgi:two-component system NarL family response regulator
MPRAEPSVKRMRVAIVEDHFMVRVGLAAIVNSQPDMTVVGEAKNGHEAVELYERHRPDVLLLDLRLPGIDGVEVIKRIASRHRDAKVIVISTYGGDEDVLRAIEAGARGYYLKHVEGEELVAAVRAVYGGELRLPAEAAARFTERTRRGRLSPRELEVFRLIASGLSNGEIATKLSISEGTVRVHVSHGLLKLGCTDRTQALAEAIRRGFIHLDP